MERERSRWLGKKREERREKSRKRNLSQLQLVWSVGQQIGQKPEKLVALADEGRHLNVGSRNNIDAKGPTKHHRDVCHKISAVGNKRHVWASSNGRAESNEESSGSDGGLKDVGWGSTWWRRERRLEEGLHKKDTIVEDSGHDDVVEGVWLQPGHIAPRGVREEN